MASCPRLVGVPISKVPRLAANAKPRRSAVSAAVLLANQANIDLQQQTSIRFRRMLVCFCLQVVGLAFFSFTHLLFDIVFTRRNESEHKEDERIGTNHPERV